ncbi:unnamed protein product [Brugia pahangi]|uniref:Secreted protein n=1 Tax=Brugia pahangi TaxID=6280 RepID=A0A0N4T0R5_BRUPA|nr:unnamed protein product [Brugia pahangi]
MLAVPMGRCCYIVSISCFVSMNFPLYIMERPILPTYMPSGKAAVFDVAVSKFESFYPGRISTVVASVCTLGIPG